MVTLHLLFGIETTDKTASPSGGSQPTAAWSHANYWQPTWENRWLSEKSFIGADLFCSSLFKRKTGRRSSALLFHKAELIWNSTRHCKANVWPKRKYPHPTFCSTTVAYGALWCHGFCFGSIESKENIWAAVVPSENLWHGIQSHIFIHIQT